MDRRWWAPGPAYLLMLSTVGGMVVTGEEREERIQPDVQLD